MNKARPVILGRLAMLALRGRKVILAQLAQLEMLARLGLRVILVLQALPEIWGRLALQGQLALLAVHQVISTTALTLAQLAVTPVAVNCSGTTPRKYQQHKSILITLMIAMWILIYFLRSLALVKPSSFKTKAIVVIINRGKFLVLQLTSVITGQFRLL